MCNKFYKKKRNNFLLSFLIVIFFLSSSIVALAAGYTWTQRTTGLPSNSNFRKIAFSSDGVKIVVARNNSYLYTSSDSGANWTARTGPGTRSWLGLTSSTDGSKLAAAVSGGYIYTSTDSGVNWTEQTGSGSRNWQDLAASSDGVKLVAPVYGGYIYTSTDSGVNWTQQTNSGSRNWIAVASSTDGVNLVGAVYGGYIYTSTDSGVNWTQQTNSGSKNWWSVTSSADGTKLAAVSRTTGYIYTSTDSGVNWTEQNEEDAEENPIDPNESFWDEIDSSSDGTVLIAVGDENGHIYVTRDSGATWTTQTIPSLGAFVFPQGDWVSAQVSPDGTLLVIGSASNGYIHNAVYDSTAPTITNISSDKTNGTYTTGEVIDIDVTFSEAVTSTGNVTVTLETGNTDRTCTFTVTNSTTGTCDYTVQSGDNSSDLTVSNISGTITDQANGSSNSMSNFVPTTNLATNKALVIDALAPTLSEVTAIGLSFDTTPAYTFSSTEAGTISYGGSCSSSTTTATSGNNTINLTELAYGSYSNCTVTVTDSMGNASSALSISSFSVNAHAAVPLSILQNINKQNQVSNSLFTDPMKDCTNVTRYSPTTGVKCPNYTESQPKYIFTRTLKLNMFGEDAKKLQEYLNSHGYPVAKSGPGSLGNETIKFGLLTKKALIKFQITNGLIGDGILGHKTKAILNK